MMIKGGLREAMSGTEAGALRERARLACAAGADLEVVVIRAGPANGLRFGAALLAAHAAAFEGVPVYVDHPSLVDASRAGGRSVRDLAGRIHEVRWDPREEALRARLALLSQAGWLRELAREAGDEPYLGLSADLWVRRRGQEVVHIERVNSVDVVVNPAAGGRFVSRHVHTENRKEAQAIMPEEGQVTRVRAAQGGADEGISMQDTPRDTGGDSQAAPLSAEAVAALAEQARAMRRALLETQLAAAGLPEALAQEVRRRFAEVDAAPGEIADAISAMKAAWAEACARQSIRGLGQVRDMRTPLDKVTLSLERLMGLPQTAEHRDAPRLSGIRELYDLLTGDWERHGVYRADRVTLAQVNTSTMPQVVANVLNKVLLRAYESRPQWWKPIAHEEDFVSMRQVRWISVGGFPDLDAVAEGEGYTEKAWSDHGEITSFQKVGNYVGITLEMIDRDDVAAVRSIPRRLGLAAYRTLSHKVAGLFTANDGLGPLLSDGVTLFHEDHGNLGDAALSADSWDAVIQAMFKQTEANSGKRLGLRPRYCLVPIELEKTALTIFTSDGEPGTPNNDANVRRSSGQVITVPEWTEARHWAAAASPDELEGVCIGYRFGRAPELFVADAETNGPMFTHDELRIKVRFVFAVGIGDYRALYKQNAS